MRVTLPGVRRAAAEVRFSFEGRTVRAAPGESMAAALINEGIWTFRESRGAAARGPYCGMGICSECLVTVDGVARRACLEPASADVAVSRHPQRAVPGAAAEPIARRWASLSPDVLVIGAGPGGLSAAIAAASAGLAVLVVDERGQSGGQYFKQPGHGFDVAETELDPQFREGRELARRALASGATIMEKTTVWGAFGPTEIGLLSGDAALLVKPRRVIVSPGAYERGVPLPGWTLPGVMTTGAVQTLLRAYSTAPGRRVLVAGNGPLNLQVAGELIAAGVDVVAVAELARAPSLGSAKAVAMMLAAAPGLVRDGANHLRALRRAGTPVFHRHALVRVEGDAKAEAAVIAAVDATGKPLPDTERRFVVDAVAMGYGFLPQSELPRALGCRHDFDVRLGGLRVERDEAGRTSVPEVFVVGDAGGLGGARVALAQGTLAGLAVAGDLGRTTSLPQKSEKRRAAAALRRHRRFQAALWSLYAAPVLTNQLATEDTIICRCEDVTLRALEALLDEDVETLGAIKRGSRAGMGRCQGRYCGAVVAAMASRRTGGQLGETTFFAPRTPFRPVPIGALADDGEEA